MGRSNLVRNEMFNEVEEKLDREAFYDMKGGAVDKFEDPVEHYVPSVREALKEAALASQEFLKQNIGREKTQELVTSSYMSWNLGLTALILFFLVLGLIGFLKLSKSRRIGLVFQSAGGGSNTASPSYMELSDVQVRKSDTKGWGAVSWSPFRKAGRDKRK